MFGIGLPEIILILVIALFVIGPDKLPEIAKTLGKALSEFKKVVDGVKSTIEEEQASIEKDVEVPEFKMTLDDAQERLKKDYEEALDTGSEKKEKKPESKSDEEEETE